jgi:hypothetical protein
MDLFSRKIVGWSAWPTIHRELVLDAVLMAVRRRRPRRTVIHSDQGTQYGSDAWRRFCRANQLDPSMRVSTLMRGNVQQALAARIRPRLKRLGLSLENALEELRRLSLGHSLTGNRFPSASSNDAPGRAYASLRSSSSVFSSVSPRRLSRGRRRAASAACTLASISVLASSSTPRDFASAKRWR